LLGFRERVDEFVHAREFTERSWPGERAPGESPVDLSFVHFFVQHVGGEIQVHGPGFAAHRSLERVVHHLGDSSQVHDAVGPLRDRLHHRELIDLLERLAPEEPDRARAAERDDGGAIDEGVRDAGREVDRAGAACAHADARLLKKTGISLRRQRGGLLVPHVDHPYLLGAARGLNELHRPAHDEEQVFGAFFLESFRQNLRASYFRHRCSPSAN